MSNIIPLREVVEDTWRAERDEFRSELIERGVPTLAIAPIVEELMSHLPHVFTKWDYQFSIPNNFNLSDNQIAGIQDAMAGQIATFNANAVEPLNRAIFIILDLLIEKHCGP